MLTLEFGSIGKDKIKLDLINGADPEFEINHVFQSDRATS
jgi:hypothetical protein